MRESFFSLSAEDKRFALRIDNDPRAPTPMILEKDIWVVWTLRALFTARCGAHLTFKGGTSLSKVYHAIDRFSEDIDVTVDIRHLVPDLVPANGLLLPPNGSQATRWAKRIRTALETWIAREVMPALQAAAERDHVTVQLIHERDRVRIAADYVSDDGVLAKEVQLEFGGRSTGEPHHLHRITCDLAHWRPELEFPATSVLTMDAERTFWEKATAVHVFCRQNLLKTARLARHWFDIVALANVGVADRAIANRALGRDVALHKKWFFRELDASGHVIDYGAAVGGDITLVPSSVMRAALDDDYQRMVDAQMFRTTPPLFDDLMERCGELATRLNTGR